MPGTLHIVATPIGNLEDLTFRAVRVLREVALIAAEDTRRTSKLLQHYGIETPTLSYHAHNARTRLPALLQRLLDGQDIAIVTDAGTPGLSDPGVEIVDACQKQGIPVNPIPGASALLAAAVASGFPLSPLTWLGFAPHRAKDRKQWVESVAEIAHTVCFLEAPHRIEATLADLGSVLGSRPIAVARELTKVHQEIVRAPASAIRSAFHSFKGEFTIVIGPSEGQDHEAAPSGDDAVLDDFGQMEESGKFHSKRDLVAALARKHGRPVRDVYALILRQRQPPD